MGLSLVTFPWRGVCALALALALGGGACSAEGERAEDAPAPPMDGVAGVDAIIAFELEGTLALAPGQIATVTVRARPPAGEPLEPYAVSFFLLGPALDASLDRTTAVADPADGGRASVQLRAPGVATSFVLRATIKDGPSADLPVAVSDQGFGTLRVLPTYDGTREAREWVASVVAGTTCEALAPTFPADPVGAHEAIAKPREELRLDTLPVGPNLAVFVRAGHYMWGCADHHDLVAGATVDVKVPIVNKPIDMSDASLTLSMVFAPDASADAKSWQTLLAEQLAGMQKAMLSGAQTEAQALLAGMKGAAKDGATFAENAVSGMWLEKIDAHLQTHGALATAVGDAITSGLAAQPSVVVGDLATKGQPAGYAVFEWQTLGSIAPADAGVPAEYLVKLTVDPDDVLRLAGQLFWLPSRYLGAVAAMQANKQYGIADFALALATVAACGGLGETLGGWGECPASCVQQLCQTALADMWQAALDSSAAAYQVGSIQMEASGPVQFDDDAALVGFEGMWVGKVTAAGHEVKLGGAAMAEPSNEPPPAQ
jgi:hypothetical protein